MNSVLHLEDTALELKALTYLLSVSCYSLPYLIISCTESYL